MPKYEITVVFAKDNKELPKKVEGYLKAAKAEVTKTEDWGVKPLAYPIKKLDEAKFLYFEAEIDSEAVKALEKNLQLDEELLRSLIVKA